MKKYLFKTLCFIMPLCLISLPLDYTISNLLKQSHQYPGEFEVMNDIYSSNLNCNIAIYGSSRAWVHIDPRIISDSLNVSAYNFGIDGHNFWLQYLRHLEFLKHNKKPEKIILSVDVFSLQKRDDLFQLNQFLPYMLWNDNVKRYTSSYVGYNNVDYNLPLIRYAGKSEALKTSFKVLFNILPDTPYRNRGFLGMDRDWNDDLQNVKEKQESYEIKIHQQSIALLEKFILECKEMDIDLILVYTPEYVEGQRFVSNRDEVMNLFKNLSLENDLVFIDYSNDEICLDKNLFYNASHLNRDGARKFSSKLAGELKDLMYN